MLLLLLLVVMLRSEAEAAISGLSECSQTNAVHFVSCQPNTFTAPQVSVVFCNPFRTEVHVLIGSFTQQNHIFLNRIGSFTPQNYFFLNQIGLSTQQNYIFVNHIGSFTQKNHIFLNQIGSFTQQNYVFVNRISHAVPCCCTLSSQVTERAVVSGSN
jgi:hypothetical protein